MGLARSAVQILETKPQEKKRWSRVSVVVVAEDASCRCPYLPFGHPISFWKSVLHCKPNTKRKLWSSMGEPDSLKPGHFIWDCPSVILSVSCGEAWSVPWLPQSCLENQLYVSSVYGLSKPLCQWHFPGYPEINDTSSTCWVHKNSQLRPVVIPKRHQFTISHIYLTKNLCQISVFKQFPPYPWSQTRCVLNLVILISQSIMTKMPLSVVVFFLLFPTAFSTVVPPSMTEIK